VSDVIHSTTSRYTVTLRGTVFPDCVSPTLRDMSPGISLFGLNALRALPPFCGCRGSDGAIKSGIAVVLFVMTSIGAVHRWHLPEVADQRAFWLAKRCLSFQPQSRAAATARMCDSATSPLHKPLRLR
jgi:hypothetical protein